MTGDASTDDLDAELRAIRDDFGKLNSDDTHYRLFKRLNGHVSRRHERAASLADAAPPGDLGKLIQSALDRVVAAKTAVCEVARRNLAAATTTEIDDAKRYLLRARTLAAQAGAPDIVTGEQARDLPSGSRVVIVDARGVPEAGRRVHDVDDARNGFGLGCHYLVLHRASAPAPKVGDVVTTAAQLDALPVGTVVRAVGGMRVTYERLHNDGWHATGDDHDKLPHVILQFDGARILDLGADS